MKHNAFMSNSVISATISTRNAILFLSSKTFRVLKPELECSSGSKSIKAEYKGFHKARLRNSLRILTIKLQSSSGKVRYRSIKRFCCL